MGIYRERVIPSLFISLCNFLYASGYISWVNSGCPPLIINDVIPGIEGVYAGEYNICELDTLNKYYIPQHKHLQCRGLHRWWSMVNTQNLPRKYILMHVEGDTTNNWRWYYPLPIQEFFFNKPRCCIYLCIQFTGTRYFPVSYIYF